MAYEFRSAFQLKVPKLVLANRTATTSTTLRNHLRSNNITSAIRVYRGHSRNTVIRGVNIFALRQLLSVAIDCSFVSIECHEALVCPDDFLPKRIAIIIEEVVYDISILLQDLVGMVVGSIVVLAVEDIVLEFVGERALGEGAGVSGQATDSRVDDRADVFA